MDSNVKGINGVSEIKYIDDNLYEFGGVLIDLRKGVEGNIDDWVLNDMTLKLCMDSWGLKGKEKYVDRVLYLISDELCVRYNECEFNYVDWKSKYEGMEFRKRNVKIVDELVYGFEFCNIWKLYVNDDILEEGGNVNLYERDKILDKIYNVMLGGGDIDGEGGGERYVELSDSEEIRSRWESYEDGVCRCGDEKVDDGLGIFRMVGEVSEDDEIRF
jgi:hypothetical protein